MLGRYISATRFAKTIFREKFRFISLLPDRHILWSDVNGSDRVPPSLRPLHCPNSLFFSSRRRRRREVNAAIGKSISLVLSSLHCLTPRRAVRSALRPLSFNYHYSHSRVAGRHAELLRVPRLQQLRLQNRSEVQVRGRKAMRFAGLGNLKRTITRETMSQHSVSTSYLTRSITQFKYE